ncbi:MAG: hypothetical protein KGI37_01570 [Alphaproteobacteria bacterium]|nr:hypothetical protein [Alphaproteobacteria bacterium]
MSTLELKKAAQGVAKKIVVKIGSEALIDRASGLPDPGVMNPLAEEIATLKRDGHDVWLVTSGATRSGEAVYGAEYKKGEHGRPQRYTKSILAAMGNPVLAASYAEAFKPYGLVPALFLLTKEDITGRARRDLRGMFRGMHRDFPRGVAVINANDSTTNDEMRRLSQMADNDDLARRIAGLVRAHHLVILTKNNLCDKDPNHHVDAEPVRVIDWRNPPRLDLDGKSGAGTGGMASKVGVMLELAAQGICGHIACSREEGVIRRALNGETGTSFPAYPQPASWMMRRFLTAARMWAVGATTG